MAGIPTMFVRAVIVPQLPPRSPSMAAHSFGGDMNELTFWWLMFLTGAAVSRPDSFFAICAGGLALVCQIVAIFRYCKGSLIK